MSTGVVDRLRRLALAPVARSLAGSRMPGERYDVPLGDPGLFGPDSVTWRVHGDPSMLIGGVAALLLQTLHPLTMAGISDHSDFRRRPADRLSRTSSFVLATTFGGTPVAERCFDVVRTVHRRVRGTAPDGRIYDAGDPDLVTWVHAAEVACFLAADRAYSLHPVLGSDQDRYLEEVSVIADRLGGRQVPRSREELRAYFAAMRPELAATPEARDTARFILAPPRQDPRLRPGYQVLARAAVGIMPRWASTMLGVALPMPVDLAVVRPLAWTTMNGLRLVAGRNELVATARARAEGRSADIARTPPAAPYRRAQPGRGRSTGS